MIKPFTVATIAVVAFIAIGAFYLCLSWDTERVLPWDTPPPAVIDPGTALVTPLSGEPVVPPPFRCLGVGLSFDQKVEALKQAIKEVSTTGLSQKVSLVFSEEEANQQAVALLTRTRIAADIPLEITGIKVHFLDKNRVVTEIKTVFPPFKPTIKTELNIGVSYGEPEVEIIRLSFGLLPLPNSVKERITLEMRRQIDDLIARYRGEQTGSAGSIRLEFNDIEVRQAEASTTITIRQIK